MADKPNSTNPFASSPERAEKIRSLVNDLDGPLGRIAECKGTLMHLSDFIDDDALKSIMCRVSMDLDLEVNKAKRTFNDLHTVAVRGEEVSS